MAFAVGWGWIPFEVELTLADRGDLAIASDLSKEIPVEVRYVFGDAQCCAPETREDCNSRWIELAITRRGHHSHKDVGAEV